MDEFDVGSWGIPALAILASAAVSWWYWRRRGWHSWPVVWKTILGGLVAARITFVLQNAPEYAAEPLSILDFSDGGFSDTAGILVAFMLGAHLTAKTNTPRRPVFAAVLSAGVVWIGGAIAMLDFAPPSTPVPLVELRRLDGTPVQLRTLTDKPMVVNLWATWCPPCRREMPALAAMQRKRPDIGFVFVNQRESAQAVQAFLAAQGLRMENVVTDPAGQLGARTGSVGFPTTLFYDAQGTLRFRHVGELSEATLREKLETLAP